MNLNRSDGDFDGFTIYVNPHDCPGCYVLRAWTCVGGRVIHNPNAIGTPIDPKGLAALRATMMEMGLTNMGRYEQDDPVILETWM